MILVTLVFSALVGAIIWDLITWYIGLPTSSSHALVGGLVGGGLAALGSGSIISSGVEKVVVFMIVSPIIGMVAAFILTTFVIRAFYRVSPTRINRYFKTLQLFSAFFYSVTHGTNDAQKTMGIITVLLVAYGSLQTFDVPLWVILAAHISISLGTFFGGWRIVKTMAQKITKLRPYQVSAPRHQVDLCLQAWQRWASLSVQPTLYPPRSWASGQRISSQLSGGVLPARSLGHGY